jgi:hypothetical protein
MAGANVFNRLSFSFNTGKFGDAIFLADSTKDFLNTQPVSLETWQKNDLANGTIITTNYYKNPLSNNCATFKTRTQNLYSRMISIEAFTDPTAQTIIESARTAANTLILEIDKFKSHTDNVSGVLTSEATVPEDGSPVIEYPDYDKSVQIGQDLLMLLNNTDGIQDSTPVLGNMTSLFIRDELQANSTIILNDYPVVNNTIFIDDITSPGNLIVTSNITTINAQAVYNHINTAYVLINTRREHDWNFYRQGLTLLADFSRIDKLENVGNTQTYLIKNLIGTDAYIEKISANT